MLNKELDKVGGNNPVVDYFFVIKIAFCKYLHVCHWLIGYFSNIFVLYDCLSIRNVVEFFKCLQVLNYKKYLKQLLIKQ